MKHKPVKTGPDLLAQFWRLPETMHINVSLTNNWSPLWLNHKWAAVINYNGYYGRTATEAVAKAMKQLIGD